MGKNRKSGGGSGGGNSTPRETPEEFQARKDDARETLEQMANLAETESEFLSRPQIKRLIDTVMDENIHFVGMKYNQWTHSNYVCFEERTVNPDGSVNVTELNFDTAAYKNMYKKNGNISIEDMVDAYHSIPLFQRNLVSAYNFGGTGKSFNGGFYSPSQNTVNLNGAVFSNKYSNRDWIRHALNHENTHATDHNLSNSFEYASDNSSTFRNILKSNKASSYSESYAGKDRRLESLAEAVAITRTYRLYGNDHARFGNPDGYGEINYTLWAKRNPKLADFANKYVDCNSVSELKKLFGI